ncbi:hypothetical protein PP304_gp120 [Gordonia phage Phendrix]|uniref:Uncharacterized protein n=2 Tax=Godonkavirus TaxID=2733178 RepID=A0A4D6E2U7_9CAUD|nr:hypothetical protein HOV33_gp017 [Gordonia phage GodonK]YP_009821596.1 hypothetical protein HOV33_gp125 [Gordonia phage GodonK]YP_010649061.1 hypothetical protein PP304_gp017 [Gordonia phage Phendrix]YP_010649247.1 hypothetical protein PP304_gp120 [Gordonia phage Phendrix]QBZ72636.1 hypothetical protein SEA_GODONK_17 [Gordonia phage GodonK]QBZ72831.1 hypothetical protein SEA_GODONK_243 [Gordonia phage GodonK]QDK02565.1 hypothetical protein SEA_PHENDRIX_17 [Gordonia phage Phendrix]QDK02749
MRALRRLWTSPEQRRLEHLAASFESRIQHPAYIAQREREAEKIAQWLNQRP